ncbi:hypothetical protein [Lusitaniella coriacea]|uniref:DUF7878 domain-containing protein n=1 Tax=Lusitaniella coriacea TaxID=1983105 RepID=UPI003CEAD6DF
MTLSFICNNITSSQPISKKELRNRSITAYVEGDLEIHVNKKLFFKEEGLLLVELYFSLKTWLSSKNKIIEDFRYESMDFEEEHILEFIERKDRTWYIHSEWQLFSAKNQSLSFIEIEQAANSFFLSIEEEIEKIFNLNIRRLT